LYIFISSQAVAVVTIMSKVIITNLNDDIQLFDQGILDRIGNDLKNAACDDMSEIFRGKNKSVRYNTPVLHNEMRFPMILHTILESDEHPSIISWCLDLKSFIIYDIKKFQDDVMPKYFRSLRWETFLKQLNLYGFKSMKIPHLTVYYHRHFVGNKPGLVKEVKRVSKCRHQMRVS